MEITARITTGIKYKPFLCSNLKTVSINELTEEMPSSFILAANETNRIAASWWVSAKRTRSYPYTRVYDTLNFKPRITVIPVIKDEGEGGSGDRDYLQWDTVSLMSLLDVHVIVAYYSKAIRSSRYPNKITQQRFDMDFVKSEINELMNFHSSCLHWNLSRMEKVPRIADLALEAYGRISRELGVRMHSRESALKRIAELKKGTERFKDLSRENADMAAKRESVTEQPKEKLEGHKARITIRNFLGGNYFWTCDEAEILGEEIHIIESKHSHSNLLPKSADIKDALLKMVLFTNLGDRVEVDGREYKPIPLLKLTTENSPYRDKESILYFLKKEAATNGFGIKINKQLLDLQLLS